MRAWVTVVAILFALPAAAWTPVTEQRMAQDAARLAPPDLRLLLDKFDRDYARGVEDAAREESSRHRSEHFAEGGALKERIRRDIRQAIAMIHRREPMYEFVYRLGTIVHLVGDANNPFHVASRSSRIRCCEDDFERYVERRIDRFRPVFYGLRSETTVSAYLDGTISRTMGYDPLLAGEYFRGGRQRTSSEFDDKSVAFGVASLTYSHAVSDVVNIYYYIWQQAGGDVRQRPRQAEAPPGGRR